MSGDPFREDDSSQLRKRLWGAAVLIAIAVIVLPLLLDGGGSESQFRRVERLREEPPAIVDTDGTRSIQSVPEMRSIGAESSAAELVERVIGGLTTQADEAGSEAGGQTVDRVGSEAIVAERLVRRNLSGSRQSALSAWVVQVAAFSNEGDALKVRDQLRRAGFASFVRDRDANTDPFRVLVGPMIKRESAEAARERVAAQLQNDPVVTPYP